MACSGRTCRSTTDSMPVKVLKAGRCTCPHCGGEFDWGEVELPMLSDSPPDGRTLIDPPKQPPMDRRDYGQPKVTKGLCGWDDKEPPSE